MKTFFHNKRTGGNQAIALQMAFIVLVLGLTGCAMSRPDLVWTEDGRQHGKASWYDDHMERTANGELYNMHAMTAAHPSLPLNSVVEVANLDNGRRIKVRVNDRLPPIHEGRVIDLSKAAFTRLGWLGQGLLDVEVRVIEYGNNKYNLVDRAAPNGKMYLPKPSSVSRTSSKSGKTRQNASL
jgi:rare lipoprotein A